MAGYRLNETACNCLRTIVTFSVSENDVVVPLVTVRLILYGHCVYLCVCDSVCNSCKTPKPTGWCLVWELSVVHRGVSSCGSCPGHQGKGHGHQREEGRTKITVIHLIN